MFPFVIFLSASAPLLLDSPCPAIEPIKNFNLTALASGKWYEIARYPGGFEKNGNCVVAEFKSENNAKQYNISEVSEGRNIFYDGYIEVSKDAGTTGAVNLHSPSLIDTDGSIDLPIYFLDVDYNNYYIGYKCKYDAATKQRQDYAWIASRAKTPSPAVKAKIDDFLKSVDQKAHPIDVKKLIWIEFTDDACKVVKS